MITNKRVHRLQKRRSKIHYPKNHKKTSKPQKYDEEITSEESNDENENNKILNSVDELKINSHVEANESDLLKDGNKETLSAPLEEKLDFTNIMDASGKFETLSEPNITETIPLNCPVTCMVISNAEAYIFVGSKNGCIYKLLISSGKKIQTIKGHKRNSKKNNEKLTTPYGIVMCLALSYDDKFLVSSSEDSNIFIWNAENFEFIHILQGHRKSVYGLSFQRETYVLFSCSADRMVKVWNVERVGFIDTLYGHELSVIGVDSLQKERAISASRDCSIRLWKIPEQSQLVFNAEKGSYQTCVAMLSEQIYVSGSEDGTLYLWTIHKRRPVCIIRHAHTGCLDNSVISSDYNGKFYEISAIAVIPHGNIVATGSSDGYIRIFKLNQNENRLDFMRTIKMDGHINDLQFSRTGSYLIAGCGNEERLGRWDVLKDKKLNCVRIIKL